jgi:hypothetical protein
MHPTTPSIIRHVGKTTSLFVLLLSIGLPGCTYYEPVPVYAPGPSKFDRAWDAALGAAKDVGVDIASADRATGVIQGSIDGSAVTISVWRQADGSVRVEINARSSVAGPDAALADRLSRAYDRRMGR